MSNELLKIVPTIQSAALLQRNIRFLKKRKKRASDFLSQGVENIVGTSLIKAESDFLNS